MRCGYELFLTTFKTLKEAKVFMEKKPLEKIFIFEKTKAISRKCFPRDGPEFKDGTQRKKLKIRETFCEDAMESFA